MRYFGVWRLGLIFVLVASAIWGAIPRPQAQGRANGVIALLAPGAIPPAGCEPIYGQADRCVWRGAEATPLQDAINSGQVLQTEDNYFVQVDRPEISPLSSTRLLLNLNDPLVGQQWHLRQIWTPQAWPISTGVGVLVAILDTGIDFTHPDLDPNVQRPGRDFITRRPDASDDHGHGTHVAGIVAAVGNNAIGGVGVAYHARLLPVKVLAANGSGDHASIASGIAWAADQGVKVINMSFGGQYSSTTLENAVNYAWSKGAVLTCAAGNNASVVENYPAAYARCIAVAATDQADRRASFSNWGGWVDVAAPGVGVWSTTFGGGYQPWQGTSMAAPVVAGVAALVSASRPEWSGTQIRAAIENTTDPVQEIRDIAQHGRVNAARALSGGDLGPATPTPTPGDRCDTEDLVVQLECRINHWRAINSVSPLSGSFGLRSTSQAHAELMRDTGCLRRDCPGEAPLEVRILRAGVVAQSVDQVFGVGWSTPKEMTAAWMASAAHRAILLNSSWSHMGCGWTAVNGVPTAVCDFAEVTAITPLPTITRSLPLPSATPTALVRPPMPTPSPLRSSTPTQTTTPTLTSTPTPAAWYRITVYRNVGNFAAQLASWLCSLRDPGVRCEDY